MRGGKRQSSLKPGTVISDSDYHAQMLLDAKKGDVSAARDMLRTVLTCIERGYELPDPVKRYLHGAFSDYLNGEKQIEKALLLSPPAHRPSEIDRLVDIRVPRKRRRRTAQGIKTSPIATTIRGKRPQSWIVARIFQRLAVTNGGKEAAMEWVARRYGVPFETLRDYVKGASEAFRNPERRKRLIYFGRMAGKK